MPEAKVPDGCSDLLLVVVSRTPVPDCNEVNIVMPGQLDLNMLKIKINVIVIAQPDYLYTCQYCARAERKS